MDKSLNEHIRDNTNRFSERRSQRRLENEIAVTECGNNEKECLKKRYCNDCELKCKNEHGAEVYITNLGREALKNKNFRESFWTGKYLQMTLMSIPCGEDIGVEIHCDTDQYIRIEHGCALALTGYGKDTLSNKYKLNTGEGIFIPAGIWHNIINIGRRDLKISSIYAPPHHPKCTVERYKNK